MNNPNFIHVLTRCPVKLSKKPGCQVPCIYPCMQVISLKSDMHMAVNSFFPLNTEEKNKEKKLNFLFDKFGFVSTV